MVNVYWSKVLIFYSFSLGIICSFFHANSIPSWSSHWTFQNPFLILYSIHYTRLNLRSLCSVLLLRTWFDSQTGGWLPWLIFSCFTSVLPSKLWDSTINSSFDLSDSLLNLILPLKALYLDWGNNNRGNCLNSLRVSDFYESFNLLVLLGILFRLSLKTSQYFGSWL